jgi:hypothetical protein
MNIFGRVITAIAGIWFLYLGIVSSGFQANVLCGLAIIMAGLSQIEGKQ